MMRMPINIFHGNTGRIGNYKIRDLKTEKNADDHGVKMVLIMCDAEGDGCESSPELFRFRNPVATLRFEQKSKRIQFFLSQSEWHARVT